MTNRLSQIPGGQFVEETGSRQSQIPGGRFVNATAAAPAATAIVWGSTPSSGAVNAASTNFNVSADSTNITGTVVVTPATDIASGGTFATSTGGSTLSLTSAAPSGTFTFTPSKSGTHTISLINNGGLNNPLINPTYTVTPAVSITLSHSPSDSTGWPGLSGLKWAWFDATSPGSFSAPTDKGTTGTTDGASVFTVSLPNSTKTNGQTGWLIITDSDGTWAQNPPGKVFSGPVIVT